MDYTCLRKSAANRDVQDSRFNLNSIMLFRLYLGTGWFRYIAIVLIGLTSTIRLEHNVKYGMNIYFGTRRCRNKDPN